MMEVNDKLNFKHKDIIERPSVNVIISSKNSSMKMSELNKVENIQLKDFPSSFQVNSEASEMIDVCKKASRYARRPKPKKNREGFLEVVGNCVSEFNIRGGSIRWISLNDVGCCSMADFHGKIKTIKYTVDTLSKIGLTKNDVFKQNPVTFMRGVCFCSAIDIVAPIFCEKINEFLLSLKTGK